MKLAMLGNDIGCRAAMDLSHIDGGVMRVLRVELIRCVLLTQFSGKLFKKSNALSSMSDGVDPESRHR